ncbi:MAG: ABC transporter permease [Vicinamibacterales bacterium]
MTSLRVLAMRVKAFVLGSRGDLDLDDDIRAHLDLLIQEYIRRGLSSEDAYAAARRAFGGVEQMKEMYRDQRGLPLIDGLVQDLRYAGRMLRRDPGFTAVAVLSLAMGIGASTAAFSVFNAVMLRPLPVPDPDRLVLLEPQHRGTQFILFNPIFEELRRRQRTLAGVFAATDQPFLKVTFDDAASPAYVRSSLVSGSYFSVLGVSPSLGRLLTERDDQLPEKSGGESCAAVISHQFWDKRFQQNADVLRRTLLVRDMECAIVGVAPAGFISHQGGYAPEVWLPLRPLTDRKLLESRSMAFFGGVMGRLAPGVGMTQAETELTTLYQQILAAGAETRPADFRIHVVAGAPGFNNVRRQFGTSLTIVLAAVGVVLLIASANVATLLLGRGAARLPELATRAALGAGRLRLMRQLVTEGTLLAALGAVLGLALAWIATPALASLVWTGDAVLADPRVIAVGIGATLLAAVICGVVPALRVNDTTLRGSMAREGRATTGNGQRLTGALVAAQLALSLVLVTAAGLLLRTVLHLTGIDPGFRPEHVVMLDVRDETPGSSFGRVDTAEQKARRAALYRTVDERLNALPGVRAASVSWLGLFSRQDLWLPLIDADHPESRPEGRVDYVSPRYFETMGMQIFRGRGLTDRDREGTERVAVVNEALARARFGGGETLGRRLATKYAGEEDRPFTIVGIVRDSKYNNLRELRTQPMMWMPIAQAPSRMSSVALRVEPHAEAAVARQAETVLQQTDTHLMVREITTLSAQLHRNTARERLLLGLSSGFGGLGVLLAGVGLYGTLAYAVRRRTREIGIRLAFGAPRHAVLSMILSDALRLVALGIGVGVPIAVAGGYSLRAFLFGVAPIDPAALAAACAVLALAALLAAYIPARRAAAVDPLVALRWE